MRPHPNGVCEPPAGRDPDLGFVCIHCGMSWLAVEKSEALDALGRCVTCAQKVPSKVVAVERTDAQYLRRAAAILRRRSSKPDGLWMRVICNVLTDTAQKIESASR